MKVGVVLAGFILGSLTAQLALAGTWHSGENIVTNLSCNTLTSVTNIVTNADTFENLVQAVNIEIVEGNCKLDEINGFNKTVKISVGGFKGFAGPGEIVEFTDGTFSLLALKKSEGV